MGMDLRSAMLKAGVVTPEMLKAQAEREEALRKRVEQERLKKIAEDLAYEDYEKSPPKRRASA